MQNTTRGVRAGKRGVFRQGSEPPVKATKACLTMVAGARLCLEIVLWIPVGVVYDDGVCSSEVDANTSRAGAQ